ncbi:MAG TPA: DUF721 domain-containing protein [Candidatus Gracilibacteria bacterium]|nr:DUF721 domain-containing protein [Candidatus Gracilibacteria bacterium]
MELLGDILRRNLQQYGLSEAAWAASVLAKAQSFINQQLGTKASKEIKASKIQNKILYWEVKNSAWAQEFHFIRTELLEYLRTNHPQHPILDFRIQIKNPDPEFYEKH